MKELKLFIVSLAFKYNLNTNKSQPYKLRLYEIQGNIQYNINNKASTKTIIVLVQLTQVDWCLDIYDNKYLISQKNYNIVPCEL